MLAKINRAQATERNMLLVEKIAVSVELAICELLFFI
jgi:hypothetical protein